MTAPAEHRAYVEGIALWAPRLPGWEAARAILRGDVPAPETPATRPAPALLPPNERRRAPDTVAISLEVAAKACAAAQRNPAMLPCVFASTHGDLAITDYMCETLAKTPEAVSPTKFHNSVHNAAAGYWTIGTHCLAPYTALSALERSFAHSLVDALTQVECDDTSVLCVAYDIEARGPLGSMTPSAGILGAALVLSPRRGAQSRAALRWRARPDPAPRETAAVHAALVAGNAMASCLALFEALAAETPREVVYALGPGLALDLMIEPLASGSDG